jgi:Tfp pilus assembly protein PilX
MTSQSKMTSQFKSAERGVALLFCLFALLILSAVTTALILLSGTETSVNANYRSEEVSFFAAKSGIYEALDRMQATNANPITLPTSAPSAAGGVVYLINSGSSLTVQPWSTTNAYFDDELCHEGYTIGAWTRRRAASLPMFHARRPPRAPRGTRPWPATIPGAAPQPRCHTSG